ncbi:unnamed protein product [Bemisia tabaci]|uniref:Uncharacterized protein n=1 Tax=Bemisia tabaci TaxID=7038 RepID=A0A9P0ABK8_BEMTA|nr:PREDICTED: uncharacterized protein LOC109039458 [Bemisia tabaci]CAH0387146.1 unnamed protein product [Bemisia tabaci]
MTTDTKNDYPKASQSLEIGGMLNYIAGLILLIAFCSPYWISSYDESSSPFKTMGIWEYCFEHYRHPNLQFDILFDGCYAIYSNDVYFIREWLLPGWLLFIQMCVLFAIILSFGAQFVIAGIVIRYPRDFVLTYEYLLSGGCFIATAVATFLLFLAVALFPLNCWRQDWIQFPKFNHLSGSYYLCIVAFLLHAAAAWYIYKDARRGYRFRQEKPGLIMQMYPQEHNGYA